MLLLCSQVVNSIIDFSLFVSGSALKPLISASSFFTIDTLTVYALYNADLAARGITAKVLMEALSMNRGRTPQTEICLLEFSKTLSCLFQSERRSKLNRLAIRLVVFTIFF